MSDIEKARRKLQISGYEHPTNTTQYNSEKYKTLDTESTHAKYITSRYKPKYATFSEQETVSETTPKLDLSTCPKCKNKAMFACNCPLKDKQCSNGHVWYINNSRQIAVGDPHEDE